MFDNRVKSRPLTGAALALAAVLASGLAPAQAYTIFTSRTAWQAAVDALGLVTTTDTFSTAIASAQSITFDTGIVSANSPDVTLPNVFENNSVSGGFYNNAVQGPGGTASVSITWTFPGLVRAFGADFFSTDLDRLALRGDFDAAGVEAVLVNNTIGSRDGFLGVIGTAGFGSIGFNTGNGDLENFQIDSASFAVAVPAPASLALLGAGLLGLGAIRRRA